MVTVVVEVEAGVVVRLVGLELETERVSLRACVVTFRSLRRVLALPGTQCRGLGTRLPKGRRVWAEQPRRAPVLSVRVPRSELEVIPGDYDLGAPFSP